MNIGWIIVFFLSILLLIISAKYKKIRTNNESDKNIIPIDPETKERDLSLVYEAIDNAINKTLYYYAIKDLNFSEKSKVKLYNSGHYRDLINYLIRDDIFFTETMEDGTIKNISFFDCFFQKVYLHYVTETSKNIKSLFFKYYSGLSIEDYGNENAKPSIIPFLVDYVKNYLLLKYDENEQIQSYYLDRLTNTKGTSEQYESWLSEYDMNVIRKICLNIYHKYDASSSISDNTSNTTTNEDNKEKKNEFSIDFHEQSK
jgi:hypothetical protein